MIEDPGTRESIPPALDERHMGGRNLVGVVRGPVAEEDPEPHLERLVINGPVEIDYSRTDGMGEHSLRGKDKLGAVLYELGGVGRVLEGEKDPV